MDTSSTEKETLCEGVGYLCCLWWPGKGILSGANVIRWAVQVCRVALGVVVEQGCVWLDAFVRSKPTDQTRVMQATPFTYAQEKY
jgi:hypothetical protein